MPASSWTMPAISDEQRAQVEEELRRRAVLPRTRERLAMIEAAGLGHELDAIVRWSGRAPRTVRVWLDRFAVDGVAGLADAPRPGRPARADAADLAALERAVETPPRELGAAFAVWPSARLSTSLADTTGVQIAPGWRRARLTRRDCVGGRPKHTLEHPQGPDEVAACKAESAAAGGEVAAEPDRYALHYEDETHVETDPHPSRVWRRRGHQPTIPAVGTDRRVTVVGSVEARGRGRVEVLQATQDSASFARSRQALDGRHVALGRAAYPVLDNGPCHTGRASAAALAERAAWLHGIWLARYSPRLTPTERAWRDRKRDARGHLAPTPGPSSTASATASITSAASAATSSTRSPTGSSTAIVAHRPDGHQDDQRGPRTPALAPPTAVRIYQRLLTDLPIDR